MRVNRQAERFNWAITISARLAHFDMARKSIAVIRDLPHLDHLSLLTSTPLTVVDTGSSLTQRRWFKRIGSHLANDRTNVFASRRVDNFEQTNDTPLLKGNRLMKRNL